MALTVREVMDAAPTFVDAGDPTERGLVLRVHELPGVAVGCARRMLRPRRT